MSVSPGVDPSLLAIRNRDNGRIGEEQCVSSALPARNGDKRGPVGIGSAALKHRSAGGFGADVVSAVEIPR